MTTVIRKSNADNSQEEVSTDTSHSLSSSPPVSNVIDVNELNEPPRKKRGRPSTNAIIKKEENEKSKNIQTVEGLPKKKRGRPSKSTPALPNVQKQHSDNKEEIELKEIIKDPPKKRGRKPKNCALDEKKDDQETQQIKVNKDLPKKKRGRKPTNNVESIHIESAAPTDENLPSGTGTSIIGTEKLHIDLGVEEYDDKDENSSNRRAHLRRNASKIAEAALNSISAVYGEDDEDEYNEGYSEVDDDDDEYFEKPAIRGRRRAKRSEANKAKPKVVPINRKPKERKNSKAFLDVDKFFEEDIIHNVLEAIKKNTNAHIYAGAVKTKHRIQFLFGHNADMLLTLYRNNLKWRNLLFLIDKSQILEDIEENSNMSYQLNYKQLLDFRDDDNYTNVNLQKFKVLSELEYESYKGSENSVKFRLNEDQSWIKLNPDEFHVAQQDRNKLILNFNGVITDMQWLNNVSFNYRNSFNYLFLGMVNHDYKTTDRELSIFNTKYSADFTSFLKIYRFNSEFLTMDLKNVWVFKGIGQVKEIKFAFSKADKEGSSNLNTIVGLLFGDGVLRFYKYGSDSENAATYLLVKEPYKQIKIQSPHYISTFEFLDDRRVIVGTLSGYLAEFDIFRPEKPMYFVRKHFGSIWRIILERPIIHEGPSYLEDVLIHTISADHTIKFCSRRDIAAASVSLPTRRFMFETPFFEYLPFINCMIYGSVNEGRCYPSRNVKGLMYSAVKHTAYSTALSLDASYLHPFLVSGSSSGEVIIKNYISEYFRRKKVSKKTALDTGFLRQYQLNPLKFEYNSKLKGFKINSSVNLRDTKMIDSDTARTASEYKQQVTKDNDNTKINIKRDNILYMRSDEAYGIPQKPIIYPFQVSVSKVKWCDTVGSYPWYGVALVEDILVVDCMNHCE